MRSKMSIPGFLISYFCLLYWIRYAQLKTYSYLMMSNGMTFIVLSFWFYMLSIEEIPICYVFGITGAIIYTIGFLLAGTKDSGIEKEIRQKTTIFERLIGKVPSDINIEEAQQNPTLTKTLGVVTGSVVILEGFVTFFLPKYFGKNITVNIVIILIGIVMILFTFIYGAPSTPPTNSSQP